MKQNCLFKSKLVSRCDWRVCTHHHLAMSIRHTILVCTSWSFCPSVSMVKDVLEYIYIHSFMPCGARKKAQEITWNLPCTFKIQKGGGIGNRFHSHSLAIISHSLLACSYTDHSHKSTFYIPTETDLTDTHA